jgi:hypothetical protein|tara:strand:- start:1143 stop:2165 length:1023 start_codon:yes stop_codon:yes gene_type:complete
MSNVVGFDDGGLPLEEAVQEDFSEFEDIQRALAKESGQDFEEATEDAGQVEEVDSLVDNGIDSAELEADAFSTEPEPEEPKTKAKGSRADKRIQNLVKERKQLEQQLHQRDQYYQQHLAAMQQQIAAQRDGDSQAMQEQLALQRQQLELMQSRGETAAKGELSPMEEYRLNIIKEATEKAGTKFSPEVEALKQKLDAMEAQRQQEIENAQRQQRYNHYNQQTQVARDGLLLKGFAPDRAKQLAEPMDEMLLAFCGAFGVEPNVAAPQFKKYLDLYVQGSLESRARGGGQKIRKGRAVPKSAPSGKRSARQGNAFPKPDVLRKAGFDSALDWIAAGEPIIT